MPLTLGTFIRERRRELGLTQERLAERVGESVRQSDISRLERNRISLPRRDRLEALAAALEVSTADLLLRTGWLEEKDRLDVELHEATVAYGTPNQLQAIELQNLSALIDAVATVQQMVAEATRILEHAEGTIGSLVLTLNPPATERGPVDQTAPQQETSAAIDGQLSLPPGPV